MTQQEIENFRTRVSGYIDNRRLRDALSEIKALAASKMDWEISDRIKQTEQNYAYMLQYLTDGADDPDRANVYTRLVCDIYGLLDNVTAYIESADLPTLYYSCIRAERLRPLANRLADLADRYVELADKLSLFSIVAGNDPDRGADRKELERVQQNIFIKVWTTPLLSHDEQSTLSGLLLPGRVSPETRQHVISALTLGILQQFDSRKLELLMDSYLADPDMRVSSAALVGTVLALWKYANRPLPRGLCDRLGAMKDTPGWSADLRITFMELIRARDTERINRKMRDEVIPRMEKLRPDMFKELSKIGLNPDEAATLDENPEWQELLDKSGVTDQLKELTEIQMEGGDVMMSTFSHLKNFPFFQNIANWFLPFDSSHSDVSETVRGLDILGDMMENSRFLCDSDKYSFMFAICNVPAAQRDMMVSQMKAQSAQIYEMMGDMTAARGAEGRRVHVNSYMQNIYRFFKLYSRRGEFFDPFDRSINLISVRTLADDFRDTEMLTVVAEFYFKLRYMADALEVYAHLEKLSPGDAARYQKIGYCHERLGDFASAIEYYDKAELLDAQSAWTVRRLAACYRAAGDNASALEYYRRLSAMLPDDISASMLYGQSLMVNGQLDEALHQFYKVEFLDGKSTRAWRPIAWTLFLMGDHEGADRYYKKILLDNPSANDYLNMGHAAAAAGNMREAVNDYALAVKSRQGDKEWFIQALAADTPSMRQAGVDPSLVPLLADATLYRVYS